MASACHLQGWDDMCVKDEKISQNSDQILSTWRFLKGAWHRGVMLTLPCERRFQTRQMHTLALVHAKRASLAPCAVITKPYFDGVRVLNKTPGFPIADFKSIVKILDDRGQCCNALYRLLYLHGFSIVVFWWWCCSVHGCVVSFLLYIIE